MESSHQVLDISNDKDLAEILKRAINEENVIVESESAEDSVETEIEEIIEIIEEVEEEKEETARDDVTCTENRVKSKVADVEIYAFEEDTVFEQQSEKEYTKKNKNNSKHVITYDVDEDWQDEEMEDNEEFVLPFEHNSDMSSHEKNSLQDQRTSTDNKKYVNNQKNALHASRSESRDYVVEPFDKAEKFKSSQEFKNDENNEEVDNNTSHEIVKNVENNLLYTVLSSKKQSSVKTIEADKLSDTHYVKMDQLDENSIPVEGTIYYEGGENLETVYVQNIDDNEQYSYDTATMETEEQSWETNNADNNQNQDKENLQDQIFLHEDEDGQLYFKDETGTLQPVYLTEDGHYAIAENNEDHENKESQVKPQQSIRQVDEESYSVADNEVKSTRNNKQNSAVLSTTDVDNEDNTVTISLIISEDEHGMRRTQVIIPTTDNSKCDICNKSFKTSFQLLRHTRLKHAREEDITTRNFPCDLCPKRYPDQNSLARHRKTHTGDRPFQCLECHKNFPTSTALRRHLTLHDSQSRPLPCIYCGRRFVDKASLVKHEQSHLAADQRTHTCDICHKSFSHATDLNLHKKYHGSEKKFDCEVCGREFNRLNNLQRHMFVHQQQASNQEILSCDVCGITYKFMSSLTRHMVTTHMNPEKLRKQAEEQRKKRENNYRRYLENRKMYETQQTSSYGTKRTCRTRLHSGSNDEAA